MLNPKARTQRTPVPAPTPAPAAIPARLRNGAAVTVRPITADDPLPPTGPEELRRLRMLIAGLLGLGPRAAEWHGLSLPRAWAASDPAHPGIGDVGIAWFTPLPDSSATAVAEVVVAAGYIHSGLGRILFDTLVLSAAEAGVEWLMARLPADAEDFAGAIATLGGRLLDRRDGVLFTEIPLAAGFRRYHRSGTHRRVTRRDAPR